MKIRTLLTAVFFASALAAAPAVAKSVNFFTPTPTLVVQSGISLRTGSDFVPKAGGIDARLGIDCKELLFEGGIKQTNEVTDITTQIIYAPTFFSRFNLGPGIIAHFNSTPKVFSEFDFLPGLFFKYRTKKLFSFEADVLFLHKRSNLFVSEDERLLLNNESLAAKMEFGLYPAERIQFMFSLSSYSYYSYMLFFAPNFKFTTQFNISQKMAAGIDIEAKYIDFMTLSANFIGATFRTYFQMRL